MGQRLTRKQSPQYLASAELTQAAPAGSFDEFPTAGHCSGRPGLTRNRQTDERAGTGRVSAQLSAGPSHACELCF